MHWIKATSTLTHISLNLGLERVIGGAYDPNLVV